MNHLPAIDQDHSFLQINGMDVNFSNMEKNYPGINELTQRVKQTMGFE